MRRLLDTEDLKDAQFTVESLDSDTIVVGEAWIQFGQLDVTTEGT